MSNQLMELIPHSGRTLDLQADQLPASGRTDIDTFDLQGAHGLRKIRRFSVDTDLISHGNIPLGHFYNDHLDLCKKMGYFADRLT